jgi:DNA repair protein RAD50
VKHVLTLPYESSGHSLVNDPGMTDAAEVKAHIKLLFKNRGGRDCLAVRSLQVTRKKAKTEFKALEGTIRTTNDAGQVVSSSYKCMDMDRLIPENLGVSPAILENVIFVHQEDSNWPMQESSVLKKKFDDIFESTRYTKALDELKKTKKEYVEKSKNLKVDLASIQVHVQNATQLKSDLQTYQTKLQDMEQGLTEINEKISSNETQLNQVNQIIQQASQQLQQLKNVENKIQENERRIQDKIKSLEQEISKEERSDEDLQAMLMNFDQEMSTRQRELRTLKNNVDALTNEMSKYRQQMDELNKKKGQANVLRQQIDTLKNEQVRLANDLSNKRGRDGSHHSNSYSVGSSGSMPLFTNGQWNARIAKDIASFLNAEVSSFLVVILFVFLKNIRSLCLSISVAPSLLCVSIIHFLSFFLSLIESTYPK